MSDEIPPNVTRLVTRLEAAWVSYLHAKDLAQESRDIHDGIMAGRAWSQWLDLFTIQINEGQKS